MPNKIILTLKNIFKNVNKEILVDILLSAIVFFYGLIILRKNVGTPSISWMLVFNFSDFNNLHDLMGYIQNLRTGIPPLLSIFEIIVWLVTKNPQIPLVTIWLYRGSLIFSYILAIILFKKTIREKVFVFLLSIFFLTTTALIHPGNPQIYDAIFPFLILLYFFLLEKSKNLYISKHSKLSLTLIVFASITLCNIELLRPFAIIFLPIAILAFIFFINDFVKNKTKILLAFLIPIILISVGWHVKLLVFNDGQFLWSNHSGYNYSRLWADYTGVPELLEEEKPLQSDRWANLNTETHYENSNTLSSFITQYILDHPFQSIQVINKQILTYLSAPVVTNNHVVSSRWLYFYPYVLLLCFVNLFYQVFFEITPRFLKIKNVLVHNENIIILFTFLIFIVSAIGEKGEEARFIISFLPLLAANFKSPKS